MKYATAASAGVILLLSNMAAGADVYQWVDPVSRVRQLSAAPPAWYRGTVAGPRVKVFAKGRLIDDTAIALDAEDAARLRARAFGPEAAASVPPPPTPRSPAPAPATVVPPPPPPVSESPPATNAADLRALIEAWDRNREAEARSVLRETLPTSP